MTYILRSIITPTEQLAYQQIEAGGGDRREYKRFGAAVLRIRDQLQSLRDRAIYFGDDEAAFGCKRVSDDAGHLCPPGGEVAGCVDSDGWFYLARIEQT